MTRDYFARRRQLSAQQLLRFRETFAVDVEISAKQCRLQQRRCRRLCEPERINASRQAPLGVVRRRGVSGRFTPGTARNVKARCGKKREEGADHRGTASGQYKAGPIEPVAIIQPQMSVVPTMLPAAAPQAIMCWIADPVRHCRRDAWWERSPFADPVLILVVRAAIRRRRRRFRVPYLRCVAGQTSAYLPRSAFLKHSPPQWVRDEQYAPNQHGPEQHALADCNAANKPAASAMRISSVFRRNCNGTGPAS